MVPTSCRPLMAPHSACYPDAFSRNPGRGITWPTTGFTYCSGICCNQLTSAWCWTLIKASCTLLTEEFPFWCTTRGIMDKSRQNPMYRSEEEILYVTSSNQSRACTSCYTWWNAFTKTQIIMIMKLLFLSRDINLNKVLLLDFALRVH